MPAASSPGLAFAHLNLRWNPFRDLTRDEWIDLADADCAGILNHLSGHDARPVVQLLGKKGAGKTSHLLAILRHRPEAAYVHIPEGQRREIPEARLILIDEAQRLTRRQKRHLFRSDTPLVLGTHTDFSARLTRCGRSVLSVHVHRQMTVERLHRLINARIAWSRRGPGTVPSVSSETTRALWTQWQPDVRRIMRELYLQFQNMKTPAEV